VLCHCCLGIRKGIQPSDKVLSELWSEVQICIRSSWWCHCHPINSSFIKIQNGSAFLVPAYPGCPGKRPLNGCSVVIYLRHSKKMQAVTTLCRFSVSWHRYALYRVLFAIVNEFFCKSGQCDLDLGLSSVSILPTDTSSISSRWTDDMELVQCIYWPACGGIAFVTALGAWTVAIFQSAVECRRKE